MAKADPDPVLAGRTLGSVSREATGTPASIDIARPAAALLAPVL